MKYDAFRPSETFAFGCASFPFLYELVNYVCFNNLIFSTIANAYVAEWSKALDLRSIVLLYAQVRTLSYAQFT